MGRTFTESPFPDNGITCRDVLAQIAEACGCYARITADGKVKMVWYTDHMEDYVVNGDEEFSIYVMELDLITNPSLKMKWVDLEGIKWQELKYMLWGELEGWEQPFKVLALRVKMMEDDIGVIIPSSMNRNVYLIVDNQLLATSNATEETNYLYPLYTRLADFGAYIPASIKCVGNWLVEPGDIISAEVGKNNFIRLPIFTRTLKWNGACTDAYEATGNLNREIVSPSNYQTMISRGRYHIFRNDINELYSEINNPTTGLSTRISQAEGDITLLASSKATTYIGNTAPTGTTDVPLVEGDLWVDSANNNKLHRYNGSSWVACEFSDPDKYTVQSGIDITASGVTVSGGKYIKIESGGVFDVQSTNFSISSANKRMVCGGNSFDTTGFLNTDSNNRIVFFGSNSSIDPNWKGGVTAYANSDSSGTVVLFASPSDSNSIAGLTVECKKINTYYWSYAYMQTWNQYSRRILGNSTYNFTDAYISRLYGQRAVTSVGGIDYYGYFIEMNLNIGSDTPSSYGNATITYSCTANARDTIDMMCQYSQSGGGGWAYLNIWGKLKMATGFIAEFNDIYVNREYYNYAPTSRSSREIKHGIEDMESVGDRLDALKPVTYIFDDDETEKRRPGLIYEDTVEVMPEICTDDESNKGISYTELIPMLLKEIQDLRARVKTLEEREV